MFSAEQRVMREFEHCNVNIQLVVGISWKEGQSLIGLGTK